MIKTVDIIQPVVAEMLKEMEIVFREFGIDFYLVGAVARDIHLSAKRRLAAKRRTEDVDIAVMIADEAQFYAVKNSLLATGSFTAHPTEAIKLFFNESIEVDLLPFGQIENQYRETYLHNPKTFVMNVPGFRELLPFCKEIRITEKLVLNICSLEGLIVLKLIAWDDKPNRTKDISDIDHIVEVYFDLNDDEMYSLHFDVMDIYDTEDLKYLQLVSARVIGRKIGAILQGTVLTTRVVNILAKRPMVTWQAMIQGMGD